MDVCTGVCVCVWGCVHGGVGVCVRMGVYPYVCRGVRVCVGVPVCVPGRAGERCSPVSRQQRAARGRAGERDGGGRGAARSRALRPEPPPPPRAHTHTHAGGCRAAAAGLLGGPARADRSPPPRRPPAAAPQPPAPSRAAGPGLSRRPRLQPAGPARPEGPCTCPRTLLPAKVRGARGGGGRQPPWAGAAAQPLPGERRPEPGPGPGCGRPRGGTSVAPCGSLLPSSTLLISSPPRAWLPARLCLLPPPSHLPVRAPLPPPTRSPSLTLLSSLSLSLSPPAAPFRLLHPPHPSRHPRLSRVSLGRSYSSLGNKSRRLISNESPPCGEPPKPGHLLFRVEINGACGKMCLSRRADSRASSPARSGNLSPSPVHPAGCGVLVPSLAAFLCPSCPVLMPSEDSGFRRCFS